MNNRFEWHNAYIHELKDLYYIMIDALIKKYPNSDLDLETSFHNFSRMVYHCTSKYISPYSKENCRLKNDRHI